MACLKLGSTVVNHKTATYMAVIGCHKHSNTIFALCVLPPFGHLAHWVIQAYSGILGLRSPPQ